MLRCGIMRGIGNAAKAATEATKTMRPFSLCEQVGERRLRAVERGGQVDRDDPVPALARHLVERRALGDPGIDDQHVDRAVRGAGFVECAGDASRGR